MATNGKLHLVIDADDTLWENNIYFESAFERFAAFLNHSTLSNAEVRRFLDDIEDENRVRFGYGSAQFGRNMVACFEALSERPVRSEDRETVMRIALDIMEHPLQLLEGVPETLAHLASRHTLTLFTKGEQGEQRNKVRNSGLGDFFEDVVVTHEKDTRAYYDLLARRSARAEHSWMIGNSPKSDINPALEIGMNAVYIPHERNWHLEDEPLKPGVGRLLELDCFAELREHF
ncbi:MAG: HAD family hydrolase [Bryobacterales bacterium]|nr:HAD family hydrolase [Bryobacterales bacterium]